MEKQPTPALAATPSYLYIWSPFLQKALQIYNTAKVANLGYLDGKKTKLAVEVNML